MSQLSVEAIAKICHEANRAYSEILGEGRGVAWEDAPEWQKQSTINGVKFHLENLDAAPFQSHENWLKEKVADGWRYGPVKDELTKEHPCCVPWTLLPAEQKRKDTLFVAIVRVCIGRAKLKKQKHAPQ